MSYSSLTFASSSRLRQARLEHRFARIEAFEGTKFGTAVLSCEQMKCRDFSYVKRGAETRLNAFSTLLSPLHAVQPAIAAV